MDLSKILSIAGKPGLYKTISQSKNSLIVESLIDGRRIPAFSNEKISSLEEISIFTQTDDVPLKDVFLSIYKKENGKKTMDHKSEAPKLKALLEEIIPEYDRDRVYVSDIKKLVKWYNLLIEKNLLEPEDESKTEQKNKEEEIKEEDKT
jgi:hypothetical protein